MKQVLQDLKTGNTLLEDVPCPSARTGHLLIQTTKSLVSAGTERMLVNFGKGSLLQKAQQQPDKVKQALEKAQSDGLLLTMDAIRNKLDAPLPLGNCNVGKVLESNVEGFKLGERVVSNGRHAEVVAVPKNLCAVIPESVDDESAAFTVIGAIALQGIRLLKPTLGETVVVTGLGLIGLIAIQLLRANGCRVIGIDFDDNKIKLAKQFGAETVNLANGQDPVAFAARYSRGNGVDGVLITASTKSNDPIHQAATMCRKRARIVLVGVVGMQISRADFYDKELSFQVSCSYGPGRYDKAYEENGHDYPIGFVRWTEQRNFEAILDMMADDRINVKPLITHRYALADVARAYDTVSDANPLGVLLDYPKKQTKPLHNKTIFLPTNTLLKTSSTAVIGFIGAGNYASSVLVPAFANSGARLRTISSSTGISSINVGRKHGMEQATTDTEALFSDPEVNALVVTTRHNSHAKLVLAGLRAGKHLFVEKPLALTRAELAEIAGTYISMEQKPILMVGFNRRYSPHVQKIKELLAANDEPKALMMTINAGKIPAEHWVHDPEIGGGRIIGEGCHFVDLLRFIADVPMESCTAEIMDSDTKDSTIIQIKFVDGSIGSICYLANGSKSFPKERLEVYCGGGILQLDNFKILRGFGWKGFKSERLWRQDKGQIQCARAFVDAIVSGSNEQLIPFEELIEVGNACCNLVSDR